MAGVKKITSRQLFLFWQGELLQIEDSAQYGGCGYRFCDEGIGYKAFNHKELRKYFRD